MPCVPPASSTGRRGRWAPRQAGPPSPATSTGAVRCRASAIRPATLAAGRSGAPLPTGPTETGRVFTGDRSGDWVFRALLPGRVRQPAHVGIGGRRPPARRCVRVRGRTVRAAGRTSRRPWNAMRACRISHASCCCSTRCAWVVGLGELRPPGGGRHGRNAPAPRRSPIWPSRRCRTAEPCWRLTTRASRTPSPGSSPKKPSTQSSHAPAGARRIASRSAGPVSGRRRMDRETTRRDAIEESLGVAEAALGSFDPVALGPLAA